MKRQYMFTMFLLCFFVWSVVVDNVMIPKMDQLQRKQGTFSRYRVKEWGGEIGKVDLLKSELLVYGHIRDREQLYYIEYKPHFKAILDSLSPGTTIEMHYTKGFPKFWKKVLYDFRVDGYSVIRYSPIQLKQKQKAVLKFTGIMVGIYAFLVVLGLINQPRRK